MKGSGARRHGLLRPPARPGRQHRDADKADIAREFQHAVVDVLVAKALAALGVAGRDRLVVAGGVGANRELRSRLTEAVAKRGGEVFFPDLAFCTDNGAMIALVGALRLREEQFSDYEFTVRPRWDLATVGATTDATSASDDLVLRQTVTAGCSSGAARTRVLRSAPRSRQ